MKRRSFLAVLAGLPFLGFLGRFAPAEPTFYLHLPYSQFLNASDNLQKRFAFFDTGEVRDGLPIARAFLSSGTVEAAFNNDGKYLLVEWIVIRQNARDNEPFRRRYLLFRRSVSLIS